MANNLWNIAAPIIGAGASYWASNRASNQRNQAANTLWNQSSYRPYNVNTAIGSSLFSGNTATANLKPMYAGIASKYRSLGNNFLSGLSGGNLNALRNDQLSLMRQLARPDETRDIADMQTMLFNKGLLGATTGNLQMNSLLDAQSDADLKRQLQAIELARMERESLFDLGSRAHNIDQTMQLLPAQQLALGGQLGANASSANWQAGQEQYDQGINESDSEAMFWRNLINGGMDIASNFGNAATATKELGNLFSAGGGNPLSAIGETISQAGKGTWADLTMSPNTATGMSSLFAAPGSAAEWAAFSDVPFEMISEYGIGSATGAGAGAGGAGTATTGTGLGAGTTFAAVAAPVAIMAAISKFGSGSSVESAKSGKISAQLQRDIQNDPSGKAYQQTINNLITNKLWPEEGNQWVVADLIKSGVTSVDNPILYSGESVFDMYAKPTPSLGKFDSWRNDAFILSAGLNDAEKAEFLGLNQSLTAANRAISEKDATTRERSKAIKTQKAYDDFLIRMEPRRKNNAMQTYGKLRSSGYTGDLHKLEKYLGVK